jgi:putative peptidoglycan lipid II flippase
MARWPEEDHPHGTGTRIPPEELWYPYPAIPQDETPEERAARRDAYADAIDATRFNLPVIGVSGFDPIALEQLIPARTGRVQGPATLPGPGRAGEPETAARPAAASVSRASRIMALGTLVSRMTGMLRSLLIAAALGTAELATPYNLANSVPNTIYILVIGGAVNSIFVPQLVRAMKDDADGGRAFMDRLLTISVIVCGALTVLCVAAAPQIVDLYSGASGVNRQLTIVFARFCLPQVFFYGMFVMLGQILNAKDTFGPFMWTPVLSNVIQIATFGAYIAIAGFATTTSTITPAEEALLGIGTTLGIILQTVAMFPYLVQVGVRFRPRFDWRGTGLGKSMTLAKWTFGMVLVGQVSTWVVTKYGSAMDNGKFQNDGVGYTAFSNALTIWILPQAIITVSIITALLPRMSRSAHAGDRGAVRDAISYGLRVTAVAIVPCAFAFVAFGLQISSVLFRHGHTDATEARNLGYMLMVFGLGLIPYSAQYLMLRGFYAYEDTKTPFIISAVIAAVNSILSLASYYALHTTPWAVAGMCAAYGISYLVGLLITAARLRHLLHGIDSTRIIRTHAKLCVAAAIGAVVGGPVGYEIFEKLSGPLVGSFSSLAVGGGLFIGLFLLAARKMRIEEVDSLMGAVRARFGR